MVNVFCIALKRGGVLIWFFFYLKEIHVAAKELLMIFVDVNL